MSETEQQAIETLQLFEDLAFEVILKATPDSNLELAKAIFKKIAYKTAFDVDYQTIQELNK